ncbi:MAG: AAA family ATPase [Candidatus Micrarchaeota archaeon]
MAENIFRKLSAERGVFKDERALLPEYLPEALPHREREIKEVALALRPASSGGKPENVVVVGPTGTGKTACARFVLKQLGEYSQRVLPIYINCWEISTRHGILNKIASSLGEFVPRRGIATDEITERLVDVLKKANRIPIVVLDEIDRLLASQYGEEKVLYDMARANEVFGVGFGVIGITNSEEFLSRIDARIRSSLAQRQMKFERYSPQQLKDILRERAKLALLPDSLGEEVIPLCAAHAAKMGGDARIALSCLWKAGRAAEREGAAKVGESHVRAAFAEPEEIEMKKFGEIEKKIIRILREKGELASGELYSALKTKETDRTVRNYLTRLEKLGIIATREREGKKGKSRMIRLR